MNNIINYLAYKRRSDYMNTRFKELIAEIAQKKKNDYSFSMLEIDEIAEKVRNIVMGNNRKDPTPIVKIAEFFDFAVFQSKNLNSKHSGNIHINDETCKSINKETVIIVDKNDSLPQQRFVIAHELGHYLFDYIGSEYDCSKKAYSCPYLKDNHSEEAEQIANRFAASLLMPKNMFIKEHDAAVDIDCRKIYVIKYLSQLFQVEEASIVKRIEEVSVK